MRALGVLDDAFLATFINDSVRIHAVFSLISNDSHVCTGLQMNFAKHIVCVVFHLGIVTGRQQLSTNSYSPLRCVVLTSEVGTGVAQQKRGCPPRLAEPVRRPFIFEDMCFTTA